METSNAYYNNTENEVVIKNINESDYATIVNTEGNETMLTIKSDKVRRLLDRISYSTHFDSSIDDIEKIEEELKVELEKESKNLDFFKKDNIITSYTNTAGYILIEIKMNNGDEFSECVLTHCTRNKYNVKLNEVIVSEEIEKEYLDEKVDINFVIDFLNMRTLSLKEKSYIK